jgi:hypothetical protein
LPIQIGWNLSVKKIDTFFERQDTRGFKFDIDSRGNVSIVEMEKAEHFAVVKRLDKYFEVPNGGVADNPPIEVYSNSGKKNSFRLLRLVISFIIFSCPYNSSLSTTWKRKTICTRYCYIPRFDHYSDASNSSSASTT